MGRFGIWIVIAVLIVGALLFISLGSPSYGPPSKHSQTMAFVQVIDFVLEKYRTDHGVYPIGSNRNIATQLNGAIDWTPRTRNKGGEIIDAWGTPFRFSFQPGQPPQIISAGKDKTFGTKDDIDSRNLSN